MLREIKDLRQLLESHCDIYSEFWARIGPAASDYGQRATI